MLQIRPGSERLPSEALLALSLLMGAATMNKLIVIALFAAACGGAIDNNSETKDDEAWSAAGNPALFSSGLEYKLDVLPAQGQAKVIPWTGSYWPTAQDNINYKWDGASSDSAAKKYEK